MRYKLERAVIVADLVNHIRLALEYFNEDELIELVEDIIDEEVNHHR